MSSIANERNHIINTVNLIFRSPSLPSIAFRDIDEFAFNGLGGIHVIKNYVNHSMSMALRKIFCFSKYVWHHREFWTLIDSETIGRNLINEKQLGIYPLFVLFHKFKHQQNIHLSLGSPSLTYSPMFIIDISFATVFTVTIISCLSNS